MSTAVQQRVGCNRCDWVGAADPRVAEATLHASPCPHCGSSGGLHEYPTFGTWPSDYGADCPAATTADVEPLSTDEARQLEQSERDFASGEYVTLDDLKRRLEP